MTRSSDVVLQLADMIAEIKLSHPVRVGIDGVDAAGKTMLADELAKPLSARDRHVIRVSVDGFHNPADIRYRQGRNSPRGYYEDSFNHEAILSCILLPLGPGGNLKYRSEQFNYRTNSQVEAPWRDAPHDSVLLFDGVFLHRPELRQYWDLSVFIHAGFDTTLTRATIRDSEISGSPDETREIYIQRYIPGQKIYLSAELPSEKATVVVHNDEIENRTLTINRRYRRLQPKVGEKSGLCERRTPSRISPLLETHRLIVRLATPEDADFFYELWTNSRVMTNVGFPQGLQITRREIVEKLMAQGESEFGRLLVVEEKATGTVIGESKMYSPNERGIASTDVKLLPAFWGNKYGVELKNELLTYLFTHTECEAIEATPNVENIASIKMQEAVGGILVGEETYEFPKTMRDHAKPVHHYIYRVHRTDWESSNSHG